MGKPGLRLVSNAWKACEASNEDGLSNPAFSLVHKGFTASIEVTS
jgi:hypothetical protein